MMRKIDNEVYMQFLHDKMFNPDKVIVYAQKQHILLDIIDEPNTYYKVVTIDDNGNTDTWLKDITGKEEKWIRRN